MKQLPRLKLIYDFLKTTPADLNDILLYLESNNAQTSKRQVERDLLDVEEFFLQEEESMHFTKVKRSKCYQVISKNLETKFSQKTINTLYLVMMASPSILIENRKNDIEVFENLVRKAINKNENNLTINKFNQQLVNTNFYEIQKDVIFDKNIDELIFAITNHRYIIIDDLKNDCTVDNHNQTTKIIEFAPVKILYHRGAFLLAGFNHLDLKEIVIYEIGQMTKIKLRKDNYDFEPLSKLIKIELLKRFGITKNINDEVYNIKLEFTNITGSLVKKNFWHASQKFYQKSVNDNVIMTLQCGINRELLGWVFQWMYNVRILEPVILKEYYFKTIKRMNAIDENVVFKYNNIFEP